MTSVHEDKEGNYDETRNTSCLFIFLCVIYVVFRDSYLGSSCMMEQAVQSIVM
jgi:hypothetical protein